MHGKTTRRLLALGASVAMVAPLGSATPALAGDFRPALGHGPSKVTPRTPRTPGVTQPTTASTPTTSGPPHTGRPAHPHPPLGH
jgi:hypothetical protein